jgi:quinolinate synthase
VIVADADPPMNTAFAPSVHLPAAALNAALYRLSAALPDAEIAAHYATIKRVLELKERHDAVIVAHNYQVPLITAGIADFTGDSLAMARYAAMSTAKTIVVCGVYFMAESAKLLCPDKRVLIPNLDAGCSLAESITAVQVRELRQRYPGVPVVAYVNTAAAVKAEVDVCCTSANAVAVARGLQSRRIILLPDRHLAEYVALQTGMDVISWPGECEVHAQYAGADIAGYRRDMQATVLAHPECPREVQQQADFVGSTSDMARYLSEHQPERVLLLTECSMADNVAMQYPNIQFLKPCNLCRHMKSITLQGVADVLGAMTDEVQIDEQIAVRARRSLQRMLDY